MKDIDSDSPLLLSLSGGGFRGYFQAKVLELMENEFGGPIADKFVLIAGTSIGGINALALAAEVPASEMVKFYKEQGPKIFCHKPWNFWRVWGILSRKYSDYPLKAALESLFQCRTIADLNHRVLIPSVNYSTGKPQIFKTPHHSSLVIDKKYKLVDVALATSAAPTYFPIHKMDVDGGCYMVDGGLVANHPGQYACIEAEKYLSLKSDSLRLLHIGTMSSGITSACERTGSGFLTQWRGRLFDLSISAQEAATENILNFELGKRYFKIDVEPPKEQIKYVALDKATEKAMDVLSQQAHSAYQNAHSALQNFLAEGELKNDK